MALFSLLAAACGSRTGLFVDENVYTGLIEDAGDEGGLFDGSLDATRDAARDAARDVQVADVQSLDVKPAVDVFRSDCPDADSTLVYTITTSASLQSFNPSTGEFRNIGKISCPTAPGATPFSMAVDRKGVAYILFSDTNLYRVSTATAACISTSYVPAQSGYLRFGMGFTTVDSFGPTEALFVAGSDFNGDKGARGLARISSSFALTNIGPFVPDISAAELTGTGDGRLFAFYKKSDGATDSYIGEINPQNAVVTGERYFPTVNQGNGWAFAFWGGDFYMFHAPNSQTIVTRWRPSDDSVTNVATTSNVVVGAGVSTCAPQQ